MGLFSKKKPELHVELEFTESKIDAALNGIFDRLHLYKQEECMKEVQEMLQIGKNKAILNCARAATDKDLQTLKGKVAAYQELQNFIDQAFVAKIAEAKEGKKPVRGTVNLLNSRRSAAGSAI